MEIRTLTDWVALATKTLPLIPDYARDQKRSWDDGEAAKLLASSDYKTLAKMLNQFWAKLPDNASIRRKPFFDICDLCSEDWVLYPHEENNNDD